MVSEDSSNISIPHKFFVSGSLPNQNQYVDALSDYTFAGFGPSSASLNQSCETESFAAAIGRSKYLLPAQSLLEEMLSFGGEDAGTSNRKYRETLSGRSRRGTSSISSKLKAEFANGELLKEKTENYVDLLKLISLLDEVEAKYEEYVNHLDDLISSFEAVAGLGAAKSYTALALDAMSKHFCRLRNAILSQIRVTKRKMAKDKPRISSALSQLCLFDQANRQNKTSLQQWRPIRGLPEASVNFLRTWLFQHFLNPYPNESEKLALASQTGLSKNQVCNWFINARVRLWKPMIEEMYREEFAVCSTESDQLSSTREGEDHSSANDFD